MAPTAAERTLVLFNHDFDRIAHRPLEPAWPMVSAGFDLTLPKNRTVEACAGVVISNTKLK